MGEGQMETFKMKPKKCIEINHLELGTHKQNIRDAFTDRELSLYAKIEKLEKALAIAKEGLKKIAIDDEVNTNFSVVSAENDYYIDTANKALEKIDKELGE